MPRRKPHGWPRYMVTRRLASGATGYYWVAPSWAVKRGWLTGSEALGSDYAEAKRRCDEVLNPQLDAWRTRNGVLMPTARCAVGTFDWMVMLYKTSPKYRDKAEKTRRDYDAVLGMISKHLLKDGRTFGDIPLASIKPGVADRLYDRLKVKAGGGERTRTAILAMRVAQRAWNVARRDKPEHVPFENPFVKMDLTYKANPTRPVTAVSPGHGFQAGALFSF
jgi:hypothetical protein